MALERLSANGPALRRAAPWLAQALAALALGAAAFAGGVAAAQQGQPRATQGWELCNETSYVIEAVTGKPEGRSVMMRGWVRLRPGECRLAVAAPLVRGMHYLHARTSAGHRGGRREWGGRAELCVDPNSQFSIENPTQCAAMGLEERSFREVQISRRDGWRTVFSESEPYSLYRARAAGLQRLLADAGFDIREGRRASDPRRTAAAIAQFRTTARLPANANEDQLIDALEAAARRRANGLGLTLCNRTEGRIWTGVARRRGEGWESRGWWSIAPGACARTIDDPLVQEVYYVHALLEGADGDRYLAAGGEPFCTSPSRFAILGRGNCSARYYDSALFSAISARGRQGLVVEFFDRDFLPAGEVPRELAPSRDDSVVIEPNSPSAGVRRGLAPATAGAAPPRTTATQPQESGARRQGTIEDMIRARQAPPAASPQQPSTP